MKVQFMDFSQQYLTIKDEITEGLTKVFEKGDFILGSATRKFESEFAKYCDAEYAVGVNSGTDALYLAMGAIGVGPGDEVILPTFTFIATALCISYTGAKPVFVDVEDQTYNLDPEKLEAAITDKTKVIIPVHLYGQAANMNEINAIAQKHNIKVVEDAAQAHGAKYNGKRIGSLADIACFSFYPTKSLGAYGDGGIVVTNNEEYCNTLKTLRDYGRTSRYDHKVKGFNSRLDSVQSVVLSAKLQYLDEWNIMRAKGAEYYFDLLKDIDGVKLPLVKDDRTHIFQTFAVRVDQRDKVCEMMQKKDIGVLIHYPIPVHLQTAYKDLGYSVGDFPVSEGLANSVLSLPMYPHIKKETIERVCEALKEVMTELS